MRARIFPKNLQPPGNNEPDDIVGASLAPYAATWLATHHGPAHVGYYLTVAGAISLLALLLIQRPQPQP